MPRFHSLDQFLTLLHGVRRAGAGHVALCPAHEDHKQSLSVAERDEKILLHCHTGCTTPEICTALEIVAADLFLTDLPGRRDANGGHATRPRPRRIVATYDYTDEAGTLLYQNVRYDPKDFRARHPDASAEGGWAWALPAGRRVLYRLPLIQNAPEIFVVEGEKDADRLGTMGLIATTPTGGVNGWTDTMADQIVAAGVRRVFILPDNDEPGLKYAQRVLADLTARSVDAYVLRLPGLPPPTTKHGADVSDWLDLGHTAQELEATCRHAASVRLLPYLAWSDLLAADIPDPTFHLEGWIPTRGLGFLVGDSEAFKTWWALYLSVCKAKGVPMFDQIPTRQGPVLFVSEENGVVEDKRRAVALARGMGFDQPLPLYVVSDAGFNFDDEAAYARLKATVVELSITLVVVDSLVRVHRRKENASDEMNALYQDRVKPIIAMGADIMFLHHRRKSPQGLRPTSPSENDEMRGSGDLRAAAHYAIFLKALADGLVSVSPNKTRGFRKPTPYVFAIKDADHGGIVFTHEGAPKEALDKTEPCKAAVLEYVAVEMHGTATRASILAKFKGTYSKKLIDPVLKALAEKSYPLKKEKVGRDTLYHLVLAASEDELEPGSNDVPF